MSNVQDTVPVNIFVAGADEHCPQRDGSLVGIFDKPRPAQITYTDWKHGDFVKSPQLGQLVADIRKVTIN